MGVGGYEGFRTWLGKRILEPGIYAHPPSSAHILPVNWLALPLILLFFSYDLSISQPPVSPVEELNTPLHS